MQVNVKIKSFKPIIPDKWSGLIWVTMFIAGIIRNIVPFVSGFAGLTEPADITLQVI